MQSPTGGPHSLGSRPGAADDRISAAEAAEILGVDRDKVYRLMAKGRLRTHGQPHTFNQLRRGDVEEHRDRGEPIALAEAARILRRPTDYVRDLIAAGELYSVADSKRPVFRHDVEQYAAANPPPDPPDPPAPPGREGQIRTPAAALILNMSESNTRRLAAAGLIPADQEDEDGRYWYRPEQLQLVLRARAAAAAVERGELPGAAVEGRALGAPPPAARSSL